MSLITPLFLSAAATLASEPLDVAIIGASASAGWGVVVDAAPSEMPTPIRHRHLDLASAIEASLGAEHADISRHVDAMFFSRPLVTGAAEVTAAIAEKPDAVVGIDFLFWYSYGDIPQLRSGQDEIGVRIAMLEQGLKQLDRLNVPLLIGNLPDVAGAADVKPIALLSASQVPSESALKALNNRIATWAAQHDKVTLIPLAATMEALQHGNELRVGTTVWPEDDTYLQYDQLHPSVSGLLFLAAVIATELDDGIEGVTAEVDPVQLRRLVEFTPDEPTP